MAMFLQQRVQVTGRFTMKMQIKSRWNRMEYRQAVTAVIVGAVFSLAGCASVPPPKEQLAVTKAAVENACTPARGRGRGGCAARTDQGRLSQGGKGRRGGAGSESRVA